MFRNKRGMVLAWRWVILCAIALFPVASHALALGKLKVLSSLNEPLNAEIEFTSVTEKELKGLAVSLASRADFQAAGVDRPPLLSQIKFIVTKKADGRYVLQFSTEQQLDEPFLHLLLQIDWPGGRLVREYTALIDPPYKITGKPAPIEAPTIAPPIPAPVVAPPVPAAPPAAAPVPAAPVAEVPPPAATNIAETPKEEVPVTAKKEEPKAPEVTKTEEAAASSKKIAPSAPPQEVKPEEEKAGTPEMAQDAAPQEAVVPAVEPLEAAPKVEAAAPEQEATPSAAPAWASMPEYNVKKGDTLWKIADKARGETKDVSVEQAMLAIYRTNKNAFFGNNVNNLKVGKILKMPEREEVASVALPEARREFRAQYSAWQEYKLKLASASNAIKTTEAPEAPAAEPEPLAAKKPAMPEQPAKTEAKPAAPAPAVTDKSKQDDLLKIVRGTLQKEKGTPDKAVGTESARDATDRERQALADRAATMEESLESRRLENKDLSEKLGVVRSQLKKESRLIEIENQSLAQQKKVPEAKPAEPAVKLAEKSAEKSAEKPAEKSAEKSAEQVAAVKPVEKVKAEPLPPVTKPATPRKMPPASAPKQEKDLLATVMEAVQSDLLVPAIIGIVVLVGGGVALVYFRRRQKSISEFEESILSSDVVNTDQTASTGIEQTTPAATAGGDTSFLSDFSQGGMGNIHTDEVDPVAEADVYLAYGRDETAEEILKEAMVKNPDRHEIKLKLLEIYNQRNDVRAFETLAEEIYAALGGRGGKIWDKVEEMGRKLNPENPMFRGGAPVKGASSAAVENKAAAPAAALTAPNVAMAMDAAIDAEPDAPAAEAPLAETDAGADFDFEMPSPAAVDFNVDMASSDAKPAADEGLEALDLGAPVDNGIDFDIGDKTEVASDNEVKWEPGTAAATAAPEASPGAEGQGSAQWDETATKLDLAKAYIDMGDAEGARSILQEVMAEGNEAQKKQAQDLSAQIA